MEKGTAPIVPGERTEGAVPLHYAARRTDAPWKNDRPTYASVAGGLLSLVVAVGCGVTSLLVGLYAVIGLGRAQHLTASAIGLGFSTLMGFGAVTLGLVAWEDLVACPVRAWSARRFSGQDRDTAPPGH